MARQAGRGAAPALRPGLPSAPGAHRRTGVGAAVPAAMLTMAALLLGGVAIAQPPWLPWQVENDNLVSGLDTFPHPQGCNITKVGGGCVWIADSKSPSVEACKALCEANGACNSFDFMISWKPSPGERGTCKFRSDHFWSHQPGTGYNHTCGTRVKPNPAPPPHPHPPPSPPAPLPPLPPPPPTRRPPPAPPRPSPCLPPRWPGRRICGTRRRRSPTPAPRQPDASPWHS